MRTLMASARTRVALAAAALLVLGACTFTVTPIAALGDPISASATFTDEDLATEEGPWVLGSVLFLAFDVTDPTCSGAPIFASEAYVPAAGTYTTSFVPTAVGTYHWVIVHFLLPFGDFGPNPFFGNIADCADATSLVTNADLVANKTGPSVVTAGVPFAYTISATNNGPAPIADAVLTDTLPWGVTRVSAPGCTGSTILVCDAGPLASTTTSVSFTITVTPRPTNAFGTQLDNTVTVGPTTADNNLANNSKTVSSFQTGCTTSGQGTNGNDVICAGLRAVQGRGGDDVIYGANTGVSIQGGAGNDVIFGGSGNDLLGGDNDNDAIFGNGGNDKIQGGTGTDYADGGPGTDACNGVETKLSCP